MHLLYLLDDARADGAQHSVFLLAEAMQARGHQVRVVLVHGDRRPRVVRRGYRADLAVSVLAGPRMRHRFGQMRRLVTQLEPGVVHTTMWEANIIGRAAARGTPTAVVSTFFGMPSVVWEASNRGRFIGKWALDLVTGHLWTDAFHALTTPSARIVGAWLLLPRGRVTTVARGRTDPLVGLDPVRARREIRGALGIDAASPMVLAVGRQDVVKGHAVLLDAVPAIRATCPGSVVVIAGREGNDTPRLRRRAEKLCAEGAVRFLGHRDDVPSLLAAADLFVSPSLSEAGYGSTSEAFAAGVPAVLTSVPALRGTVDHGVHALLVAPGDPEALAGAVVSALTDRRSAARRAASARALFEADLAIDVVAERMERLYRQAIGRVGRPASGDIAVAHDTAW